MIKLYKRKTKEWVTIGDFLKQWKQGMQEITPLQQCTTIQYGYIVSAIGIIWGIVFSFTLGYFWMAIILLGGMVVLAVQYLGNWQKKMILKQIESLSKQAEEPTIAEIADETREYINQPLPVEEIVKRRVIELFSTKSEQEVTK